MCCPVVSDPDLRRRHFCSCDRDSRLVGSLALNCLEHDQGLLPFESMKEASGSGMLSCVYAFWES